MISKTDNLVTLISVDPNANKIPEALTTLFPDDQTVRTVQDNHYKNIRAWLTEHLTREVIIGAFIAFSSEQERVRDAIDCLVKANVFPYDIVPVKRFRLDAINAQVLLPLIAQTSEQRRSYQDYILFYNNTSLRAIRDRLDTFDVSVVPPQIIQITKKIRALPPQWETSSDRKSAEITSIEISKIIIPIQKWLDALYQEAQKEINIQEAKKQLLQNYYQIYSELTKQFSVMRFDDNEKMNIYTNLSPITDSLKDAIDFANHHSISAALTALGFHEIDAWEKAFHNDKNAAKKAFTICKKHSFVPAKTIQKVENLSKFV